MARPGWYNDNVNRSFPFMEGTVGFPLVGTSPHKMTLLPDYVIADCGFTLGGQSEYVDGSDVVYLSSVVRTGALFVFTFRASDEETNPYILTFSRAIDADPYELSYSDSDFPHLADSISDSVPLDCQRPFWSGYLVTGDMEQLAAVLLDGESFTRTADGGGRVEPALVQNLSATIVNSIGLGNSDRTRAKAPNERSDDNPTGCDPYVWPFPTDCGDAPCVYVQTDCVKGDVRFEAGYNMAVSANASTNTITFSVIANAGDGTPCDETPGQQVPLFPGESLPSDGTSKVFGGGPLCNELIRSINGTGGPLFQFKAGQGVVITPKPAENKIVIDIDLNTIDLCAFSEYSIG